MTMHPDMALHLVVLDGVGIDLGALDIVNMPAVTIVGLDMLARL